MVIEDVLKVLEHLHFSSTGEIDDGYQVYQNKAGTKVFLGSYFIEIETDNIAFPWRDNQSTIDQLKTFLV